MKDLAKRVAELFSPKPWKHKLFRLSHGLWECENCNVSKFQGKLSGPESCKVPPPIDITKLGPALECFRGISPYYASLAIAQISPNGEIDFEWAFIEATAEQIFEICVLAKEKDNAKN